MNLFSSHPRAKRIMTRLGSLILLLQRMPVVQMLFPEANFLGSSALTNSVSLAITSVVGLGAYDSVAGATAIAQISPVSGSTTVPLAVGSAANITFQLTGLNQSGSPAAWTLSPKPAGLNTPTVPAAFFANITGTPTTPGTTSVSVTAWKSASASGDKTAKPFTFCVLGFSTHPASKSINSGDTTILTCASTGVPSGVTPTYQWYRGTSGSGTLISGATGASFTTPALSTTTSYWVKVTSVFSGTTVSSNSTTATVTVAANIPTVTVSGPTNVLENSGSAMVYTLTRTGATTSALTINYAMSGTATAGTDYPNPTGAVTFAAGSATATVSITPTADNEVESAETVILTASAGTGYTVGTPGAATGTINNDDSTVTVAASPSSILENSGTAIVYTFTRTGYTANALVVGYAMSGTATSGTDYPAPTGSVSFAAGSTTATVSITPTSDNTVESAETVILTASAGTGYTVGASGAATGTINNDDSTVTVAASPSSILENSGTAIVYTFTRTGYTANALVVGYAMSGTATSGTDYPAPTGSVTFAAGSTTATVSITPASDNLVESAETIILTASAGTGYTVGAPGAATGTITNDDSTVTIAASPTNVLENSGTAMVYTVTRTGYTANTLAVGYTMSGTATAGTDYPAPSGSVTFAAGSPTTTVSITPASDNTVESAETIILTASAGTGYTVGAPGAATGTITNDDSTVTVAALPSSVLENSGTAMVYTVTRTGYTANALVVGYAMSGTATSGADYPSPTGSVTFAAGSPNATVSITPTADNAVETAETVILTASAGTGYTVGIPGTATGTITNDDTAYSSWTSVLPTDQRGPLQIPQNDGVNNLQKYAFNLDPTQPDTRHLIVGAGDTAGLPGVAVVNGKLHIEYIRRLAASNPGITYTPQCGSDLNGWALTITQVSATRIGTTDWERVVVESPADNTMRFARIMITQSP